MKLVLKTWRVFKSILDCAPDQFQKRYSYATSRQKMREFYRISGIVKAACDFVTWCLSVALVLAVARKLEMPATLVVLLFFMVVLMISQLSIAAVGTLLVFLRVNRAAFFARHPSIMLLSILGAFVGISVGTVLVSDQIITAIDLISRKVI